MTLSYGPETIMETHINNNMLHYIQEKKRTYIRNTNYVIKLVIFDDDFFVNWTLKYGKIYIVLNRKYIVNF